MNWIATALVLWLVWSAFFIAVWSFAFRAGRKRGRIEGCRLAMLQARRAERRDQELDALLCDYATAESIIQAQAGLGKGRES